MGTTDTTSSLSRSNTTSKKKSVELSKQLEQTKGETEIWRVRALKMKKTKEMVDEELRESIAAQEKQAEVLVALQASQSSSSNDDQVAELHQQKLQVDQSHLASFCLQGFSHTPVLLAFAFLPSAELRP
jgi:hypothetical protein